MEFGYTPKLIRAPGAEVLTVAGDLTNWTERERGEEWLINEAQYYEHVFFVLGNHEYYGAPAFETVAAWWNIAEKKWPRNLHFLAHGFYFIHRNMMFLGETLWTRATPAQAVLFPFVMNDAHACRGLNAAKLNAANIRAREDIERNVLIAQNFGLNTFVITHHLPTEEVTTPRWKENKYNCFFANEAGWAEGLGVNTWHFGHTHDTVNMEHCGTRYICNPYGYHGHATNAEYDNTKVIDV